MIKKFDTLTALAEFVPTLPGEPNTDSADLRFAGGTQQEAIELALYGWPEGARQASEQAERVVNRLLNSTSAMALDTNTFESDVAGAAYDVGAYIAGEPEAWTRPGLVQVKKAIRIVSNCHVSGAVSNKQIMDRGLAITALALALAVKGHPITVDVIMVGNGFHDPKNRYSVEVNLADASTGAPLDVDRLVYGLAHPTMARKLMRAVAQGQQNGKSGDYWGNSLILPNEKPDGEIDIFLSAFDYQAFRQVQDAEQWVMDQYIAQTK